jgi:hypothetical protein
VACSRLVVINHLIILVNAIELDLPSHDRTHGRAARQAVDRPRKVELGLDSPQMIMLIRRKELRWITYGDPTDRDDRFGSQVRVDMQHAVDSQFRFRASD